MAATSDHRAAARTLPAAGTLLVLVAFTTSLGMLPAASAGVLSPTSYTPIVVQRGLGGSALAVLLAHRRAGSAAPVAASTRAA